MNTLVKSMLEKYDELLMKASAMPMKRPSTAMPAQKQSFKKPKLKVVQGGGGGEKKKASIGEIRHWKGGDEKKVAPNKWVPVKEGGEGERSEDVKRIKERRKLREVSLVSKHREETSGKPKEEIKKGEYSVHTVEGHKKAPGKKMDIEGNHVFSYKQGGKYKIAHAETGKVIGYGDDLDEAKEAATNWLKSPKADERIKRHIETNGPAPGFEKSDGEKHSEEKTKMLEKQLGESNKIIHSLTDKIEKLSEAMKEVTESMKKMSVKQGLNLGEQIGGALSSSNPTSPLLHSGLATVGTLFDDTGKKEERKLKLVKSVEEIDNEINLLLKEIDENELINNLKKEVA